MFGVHVAGQGDSGRTIQEQSLGGKAGVRGASARQPGALAVVFLFPLAWALLASVSPQPGTAQVGRVTCDLSPTSFTVVIADCEATE